MKQIFHRAILFWISGVLLVGCQSPLPPTQKAQAVPGGLLLDTSALASGESDGPEGEADDSNAESSDFFSKGTPESLAHYAAGISYGLNDKSDEAIEQFYLSAFSDPTNEPLVLEISRTLLAKKQVKKAAELLRKSSQRKDASATIYIWLAQATFHQGNTNGSIRIAKTAIKKDPNLVYGYENLLGILVKAGQTNQARRVLNQASARMKSAPDLISLGEMAGFYLKAWPEETAVRTQGAKNLDRAASLKPFPDALLVPLAQAYEHVGESLKSADIYLKLLASDSTPSRKSDALRERLADIYLQAQDKNKATEQLKALVRDTPTRYPQAWFILGQLAVDANQPADARAAFERALVLAPDMEQAYYELALVQIDQRNAGEALKTLDRAREKFPRTFVGEFFTGLAYARMKSYGEATKHFLDAETIAKATEPKRLTQQFYFQLGAACEQNHEYKEAGEYFEKSLQIAPNYVEAMNYLGYMWAERGENLERAQELISRAVKKEPKNAAYLDSMGWVLYKLNKPAEALPWLLKAQEFSEEPDATLFEHQGDAYNAIGKVEKARELWKKSLDLESNDSVKKKLEQLPVTGH